VGPVGPAGPPGPPGSAKASASVANTDKVVTKSLDVANDISMGNGKTIHAAGRLHVHPQEILWLLPKKGTNVTGDWGADPAINMTSGPNKPARVCMDGQCLDKGQVQKLRSFDAANPKMDSVGRKGGDWLRVFGHETAHGTAIHGSVAINGAGKQQGGLSVGNWHGNVPQGQIHATHSVTVPTVNAHHVNTNSMMRKGGDWLRVYGHETAHGTAIHGSVAINGFGKQQGGLVVGDWRGNMPQGQIHATHRVTAPEIQANNGLCLGVGKERTCIGPIHLRRLWNAMPHMHIGGWNK
jgi:hypothetical protein